MAVRPQHGNDGGIIERRLRPIYDWMDNGNNKKALQEAEKVLKKSPSLQSARALKSLALLRLGKSSEAHSVLDALFAERPSDDTTLQAMTICYRESGQLEKVCQLYEAAVKVEPLSEELHSHLFMSYVRVGDYKSQQRAAMALYKFAPKNPYYFWAVMSIVLQAKSTEEATKKNILLSLAQKMVDNFIKENKMEAEQEARLYIMILELQEKWAEILAFLESPLYARLVPCSMPQASLDYLKKLGLWRKLNILCKELLMDNVDRWNYYMAYFDSLFELMKNPEDCELAADDTAEKCHEFLSCLLVESMGTAGTLRGPYLARLELWKRLTDPEAILGSGVALCVQYLRVFAHKPCAFSDLKPYLAMLPQSEREEHCREFLTCLGFDENSCPENRADIQRHVNCLAAWRACSPPPSSATSLHLATLLRRHYLTCAKKGLLPVSQTEFSPADMYALRAAHHYFYAAMELKSTGPLLEAATLLERALARSPANFHIKLMLVKLYHLLGNGLAADAIYGRLEVKHIQLASLGWLHAALLPAAMCTGRAAALLHDQAVFLHHHYKDSVEHLTYAYKYGTFEKLAELCAFRSRLRACAGGARAARDAWLLALPPVTPSAPAPPTELPREFTDNRDLSVIANFDPPQHNDEGLKRRSHDQEVAYVRIKDAIVNCVLACSELATKPSSERGGPLERLQKCTEQFEEVMDACPRYKPEKIGIATPLPHRLIGFINSQVPYRELYSNTFKLFAAIAAGRTADAVGLCEVAISKGGANVEWGVKLDGANVEWGVREALERYADYFEFLTVQTHILSLVHDLTTTSSSRKPKKKAQSTEEQNATAALNKLVESVISTYEGLEKVFETWPEYEVKTTLEEALNALEIEDKLQCPVAARLKSGRDEMCNEVINNIKKKVKILKGLLH